MDSEVTTSGIRLIGDDDSPVFKTEYFPDGSAIVVTERGILLVESVAKYEVQPIAQEPEWPKSHVYTTSLIR